MRFSRTLMAVGLMALAAAPAWADLKIGVVNYTRLQRESPQGKAAYESLRAEFDTKQRELVSQQAALKAKEESLQRDGATMTADQRERLEKELRDGNRELSQKGSSYQDDLTARQNSEGAKVGKVLIEEVQAYAQAQHYDLVITQDVVLYAGTAVDITPQVLAALQARGGRAPAAATPAKSGSSGH